MAICGKCKAEGVSVAHVRECYGVGAKPPPSSPDPANMTLEEEEWHEGWLIAERHSPTGPPPPPEGPGSLEDEDWEDVVPPEPHVRNPPEPDRKKFQRPAEIEEGFYEVQYEEASGQTINRIVKVQMNQAGTRTYCKYLAFEPGSDEDGEWTYWKGGMRYVDKFGVKLSLERAKEFGRLYGICVRCSARLTNEQSIANGIGPICAGKF